MKDGSYSLQEKADCTVYQPNSMSQQLELGEETYFLLLALSFNRISIYNLLYMRMRDDMTLQNMCSYIYFEAVQANGNTPC